ncbi:MAG: hypothetical protein H0Z28_05720 [Archaeoglobus sp.]|nr:hypothetical protein [Archaeoglobus sp.]
MFDRKTKLLLILGLLNDAYGDARTITINLKDFIASHPEMSDEIEEFELFKILNQASDLEKEIDEIMMKIKREVEST